MANFVSEVSEEELALLDGLLPVGTSALSAGKPLSIYLHVPFCAVRCGYCDFNTYTATEIRGVKQADYAQQACQEIEFAKQVMTRSGLPERSVSTVFFGGGTPTLLPAAHLVHMLDTVKKTWGLVSDAEITTEANPDSVDAPYLRQLADAGFTRISFGMQSAVPRVLATLDRTHDPMKVAQVVSWAKDAGLAVSLDLIYGTPGESLADWRCSLDYALSCSPDHLSAYSLIVEAGTKLARQISAGVIAAPDGDLQAEMYELADVALHTSGYHWYELSNWAKQTETKPATANQSQHNLAYWRGYDWWGIGPGAHSHIGGTRWWNVKHPARYSQKIEQRQSPAAGRETLDAQVREVERVLLLSRVRNGLQIDSLAPEAKQQIGSLVADGLLTKEAALAGTVELTLRGRLLADVVVRKLS